MAWGKIMDKLTKTYDDFFKQLIPESPLKEAFRKWNETTKQIEREKDEHTRYTGKIQPK